MDFAIKIGLFGYITLFCGVGGFLNDPKCGRNYKRDPRILGGEGLKEGEFPWYVAIKETGKHGCGGFIINAKVILTAAHCFRDFSSRAANSPKTISVTLAAHTFNASSKQSSKYSEWEQDVKVRRIIRHPHYDAFGDSSKFDIALLLLENNIQWNQVTRPVCLPTLTVNKPTTYASTSTPSFEFQNGEIALVAGWATNSENKVDTTLQKVQLTVYGSEQCNKIFKEKNVTLKTEIDSSVICAGSNDVGMDSCLGDSGSALLVKRHKVWVAIGIVSGGFGKCGNGLPGLYTRISSYLDWIDLQNEELNSSILFQKLASLVPVN